MSSAINTYSSPQQTYADMLAAARDYDQNGAMLSQAAANINALVERDGNDRLVAKTALTSMVDDYISGMFTSNSGNVAVASLYSRINSNESNLALLATKVTGNSSQTTVAAKLNGFTAGLINTANLDSSVAALVTSNASNSFKAGLTTYVSNNKAEFGLAAASDVTAASIVGKVNDAGSSININANKISLDGQTLFLTAVGNSITAKQFYAVSGAIGNSRFCEVMDAVNGFTIGMKSNSAYGISDAWTAKMFHVNSTGQFEIGNGAMTGDVAGNGVLTLGSSNRTVELSGYVEASSDFKVKKLEAVNISGAKVNIDENGVRIYAPDGTTLIHYLNVAGQFNLGGNTVKYTGGGNDVTFGTGISVTGDVTYTGQSVQSSDQRLKNI